MNPALRRRASEKSPEFIIGQPGIPDDIAHRNCVDRIVSRNSHDPSSVGMTMCLPWRAIRKPHFSNTRTALRWLIPASVGTLYLDSKLPFPAGLRKLLSDVQILADGFLDIGNGLCLRCPL